MSSFEPESGVVNNNHESWAEQRTRWTKAYHVQLGGRLARVVGFIQKQRDNPQALLVHFESCLILLEQTKARPDLTDSWLQLVEALHPWPLRWGRWEEWQRVLGNSVRCAALSSQPEQEVGWLAAVAELHLVTGRLQDADSSGRSAIRQAQQSRMLLPLATAGAVVIGALVSLGHPQQAMQVMAECLEDVRDLAKLAGEQEKALAVTLLQQEQADLIRRQGDLITAKEIADGYVQRLLDCSSIDPYRLATALRRRATIYWAGGNYQVAAEDLKRSARLFHQVGDPMAEIFSQGNLGLVYYSMARFADAEKEITVCISAAEELDAQWRLVRDIGNLAGVYIAMGKFELAMAYTERHLELARQMADRAESNRARGNRGGLLIHVGRYTDALADIETALRSFQERGGAEGIIATSIDLSLCYAGLGARKKALRLAQDAYAAAQKIDFPTLHIITARCLAQFEPTERKDYLLNEALILAKRHGRRLDEAGCYLSMSAYENDQQKRDRLWSDGRQLLLEIGAEAWLKDRSSDDPPAVAMLL